jgi:hypothetical protein
MTKDNMWHQVAKAIAHELFIHPNQLMSHHHFATDFTTQKM